ncbi:MAG: hypothetical protein ACPL3C_05295 [Pyrobaculum sp.]
MTPTRLHVVGGYDVAGASQGPPTAPRPRGLKSYIGRPGVDSWRLY